MPATSGTPAKPPPYADHTMTTCSTSESAVSVAVFDARYSQSASGVTTWASSVPSPFSRRTRPAMK